MKKMKNRKTVTLIIVMLLSLAMCATNIAGFANIVRAEDYNDFFDSVDEGMQDMPSDQQQEFDDAQQAAEEAQRAAEEAQRAAEEEAARKAQEEELAKQAEEARKAQEEEEERRAEEAKKAAEEEAARQAALEQQAREAEEAKKKEEEEEAAQEAKRKAEEEEARAKEEAERAKKEEEERKKKQEEEYSYGLRTMIDGGAVSNITLSDIVGNGDNVTLSVLNVGISDVDLVYGISTATSDVFAVTLLSGSSSLKIGDMDKFIIAYNPSAPVGTYSCTVYFKDKKDTENKFTSYINVKAVVRPSSSVVRVDVYPQDIKLAQGGDCSFYAQVSGTGGEVSQDVNWNVSGARTSGTYISDDGRLVIGNSETASKLNVIATSKEDRSVSGTANVSIQANSYNVNAVVSPASGGIVTGGGAVVQGGSVTLSAVPNKNYYFEGWEWDGLIVSTATNYTIDDVKSNINIVAKFKQNFVTITTAPDNDQAGSVVGGGRITYGGSTTLSAKAYDGYVFTGWKEGDNIISTEASLALKNITVDRKIVAKFAKTSYNVSLSCSPNDAGIAKGAGRYKLGEKVTLIAEAKSGYTFQGWTVNDQTVSRDTTFVIDRIDRDYCLNAVFLKNSVIIHSITAGVATTGGTISPCGVLRVERGSSVTYTMTPKSGFAILAVAVDGIQVGPVSSYTFNDIWSDHYIAVAFVQTDASVKKAKESGNEDAQTRKVQKVYKDSDDDKEADENHVVDLEDAANGTAGDSFVADMDLSEVNIPTDDELGITDESEVPVKSSELLNSMGITLEEASEMIKSGNTDPILRTAFYEGKFDTCAENQYAPETDTPDYHLYSREQLEQTADDDILPFLPNFSSVVNELMGPGDYYELAEGGTASVNVSLTKTDATISESDKKLLNGVVGQVPLKYFDVTMVTRVGSKVTNIKELHTPMEFIIEIPDDIYKKGQVYSVLRLHNGEVSILPDLDDDPKTITFKTDRFSSYAISKQKATAKNIAVNFAIGAIITFIIALVCFVLLMYHHITMKRIRKRARVI